METDGRLRLTDVFVSIQYPRQTAKVKHDLVELLVVTVNAVLVSAFAAGAGLVMGQRATAEKSNEITAIPELLWLTGCTVTIDAMSTQTAIANAIQRRGADYVLAVKNNQLKLAQSIQNFWQTFRAHPTMHTPHLSTESVEKNHGRIETRRCTVFDQLQCLDKPQQWKGLRCFIVLESVRTIGDKTTHEQRLYISSLAPDAERISHAIQLAFSPATFKNCSWPSANLLYKHYTGAAGHLAHT